MITHAQQPLVSWEEIQDIELVVVRRMQEFAMGLHRSVFYGSGFDLVGLRDWQPGDRPSALIDIPPLPLIACAPPSAASWRLTSSSP